MESASVNPQLVEKLTTILEQAKSGELVGFAAVTFKQNSVGADQWAFITRSEDMEHLPSELENAKSWLNG